jgi:Domain of unknown function (DUF6532)
MKEQTGFAQHKLISEAIQGVWFANKTAPGVIFSSNFKPISFVTLALVLATVRPPFVAHSTKWCQLFIRLNSSLASGPQVSSSREYSMRRPSKTATKRTWKHSKIGVPIALRSSKRFAQSYLIVHCKYVHFFSEITVLITLVFRSRNAGATPFEAKPRMTEEAKARAKKELEGHTGDTDSEAEDGEELDDA